MDIGNISTCKHRLSCHNEHLLKNIILPAAGMSSNFFRSAFSNYTQYTLHIVKCQVIYLKNQYIVFSALNTLNTTHKDLRLTNSYLHHYSPTSRTNLSFGERPLTFCPIPYGILVWTGMITRNFHSAFRI